jgi:hypothetical protein
MNAPRNRPPESDPDTLVDLVDFKWLMAGEGWWVDLSRLRRDAAYAGRCIRHGLASASGLLRQRSADVMPLVDCHAQA